MTESGLTISLASHFNLNNQSKVALIFISFFLVAFGQPAWIPINGLIAACIGYALFWRVSITTGSLKQKFWLSFFWFSSVQLVQMSWFLSHPFWYIYLVYFFIAIWLGTQFAVISLFVSRKVFLKSSISSVLLDFLSIAALWTIFEWSRLYLLSGLSWNPVGLAYTSSLYALQTASLFGVFGLSFLVIFVNLLGLYFLVSFELKNTKKTFKIFTLYLLTLLSPYLYGYFQLNEEGTSKKEISVSLVQTAFPTEEGLFKDRDSLIALVTHEWKTILQTIKPDYQKDKTDLIVLPEFVVPFGTFTFVYPLNEVYALFEQTFGKDSLKALPSPIYPFTVFERTTSGLKPFVNNAYFVQAVANVFQAHVLAGLEDAEQNPEGVIEYFSSAQFVSPQSNLDEFSDFHRYSKRVLVPLGEYIPFTFCKKLAESYGVFGSFTPGLNADVMNCNDVIISPSICYEETYGDIIREGRRNGAEVLVNLTSDVWYPNSKLPRQHLDHARLRTVENGTPLLRACNTGITTAIDSYGRTIATLGGEKPEDYEWKAGSLHVNVPVITFDTIYSKFGDKLIISICFLILLYYLLTLRKKPYIWAK